MTTPFFHVEDNIPIPFRTFLANGSHREMKQVLLALQPGQSTLLPHSHSQRLCSFASYYPNLKFTRRQTEDGIRVWRI